MSTAPASTPGFTSAPRSLRQSLRAYCKPRLARSIAEILITALPFVLIWALMCFAVSAGYWPVALMLAVPAAGFLVRLFMIQHDCSHRSFFHSRRSNDWTGRIIGVLTLTPHDFWRHSHNIHHASSGNLDRPPIGGLDTLTVREFQTLPRWQQWRYRLYRHPLVLFGFGPMYTFLLDYRLPFGFMRAGRMPWISTLGTNAAIAVLATCVIWLIGLGPFLLVQIPITLLAATMGVWLFYVQHQFEATYWERDENWSAHNSALQGSSYYVLPGILRWFSANIGVHHVHHLASRIPCYRLPEVLKDYPELQAFNRVTLRESIASVRLALWDENKRRLVSFREATG